MKYLFWAGVLVLIGITSSCIKNPIHFEVFRIKANPDKFECHINGQDFVPDSNRLHFFGGPVMVYVTNFDNGSSNIAIDANTGAYVIKDGQSIDLSIQHVTGTGVYEFNTPGYQEADYYLRPLIRYQDTSVHQLSYLQYTPGHGNLTLTRFDKKNKIIAGTFRFTAFNNKNSPDSVKVTGGHFNINYSSQ